jgi:hypothetical protein
MRSMNVFRGESFDRAAVLLQSSPHPSPLPEERELVATKTLPLSPTRREGDGTDFGFVNTAWPRPDDLLASDARGNATLRVGRIPSKETRMPALTSADPRPMSTQSP